MKASSPAKPAHRVIEIKPVASTDAKVYPRSIQGLFQRWRWVFVWLTQLVFYGLCWLPWNGRQAVLLILSALALFLFTRVFPSVPGKPSGFSSTASPPMATPASCAAPCGPGCWSIWRSSSSPRR